MRTQLLAATAPVRLAPLPRTSPRPGPRGQAHSSLTARPRPSLFLIEQAEYVSLGGPLRNPAAGTGAGASAAQRLDRMERVEDQGGSDSDNVPDDGDARLQFVGDVGRPGKPGRRRDPLRRSEAPHVLAAASAESAPLPHPSPRRSAPRCQTHSSPDDDTPEQLAARSEWPPPNPFRPAARVIDDDEDEDEEERWTKAQLKKARGGFCLLAIDRSCTASH